MHSLMSTLGLRVDCAWVEYRLLAKAQLQLDFCSGCSSSSSSSSSSSQDQCTEKLAGRLYSFGKQWVKSTIPELIFCCLIPIDQANYN